MRIQLSYIVPTVLTSNCVLKCPYLINKNKFFKTREGATLLGVIMHVSDFLKSPIKILRRHFVFYTLFTLLKTLTNLVSIIILIQQNKY